MAALTSNTGGGAPEIKHRDAPQLHSIAGHEALRIDPACAATDIYPPSDRQSISPSLVTE
jgi:hypothetical protein